MTGEDCNPLNHLGPCDKTDSDSFGVKEGLDDESEVGLGMHINLNVSWLDMTISSKHALNFKLLQFKIYSSTRLYKRYM